MCGIFGAYNQTNRTPLEGQAFKKALHVIKHRGPDAQLYKIIQPDVGLGHNRLSIIDLQEASNQPFEYQHLSLVFNGEIFNYQALRQELSTLGYSFKTASDTEVIPAAYLHWGTDCVNHFNGMWAFVIYDHKQDILFCSRDRFGIKPFNYSFLNGRFVFSSEIKAMLAFDQPTYQETNYNAVSRYCRETVGAQASETWFEGVFRLPPAHNLIVTRNKHEFSRYWNYPTNIDTEITYEEAQSEYLRLFEDSIKLRLRSDVPLGLTLSGGLDSASIACKVKQLEQNARTFNTYTASFPGYPFDEYPIAKDLSDQLRMHSIEVQLDYLTYLPSLEKIVYHLESGHGSPAIFPLWNITKRAKEDITVFLEGQGADELLGGYVNSIFIDRLIDLVKTGQWNTAIKEVQAHRTTWPIKQTILLYLRQQLPASLRQLYRRYNGLESIYSDQLSMHKPFDVDYSTFNSSSTLTKRLFTQHTTGLVNLLHYGDAISMAHSLENRLPFMDYRLVEFVFRLPGHYKIQGNVGKKIHRDVMHDIVPKKITNNHNKLGFVSPLKQIFSEEKYGAIDLLLDESMPCADLFIRDRLSTLLKEHKEGKLNHERILFKVLSTKLWGKNYKTN